MNHIFNGRIFTNDVGAGNLKKLTRALSALLLISLFAIMNTGCKAKPAADANRQYYYSFTDALENEINLENKPQRVVSLVGSYAETWILAGGNLVGVTDDVIRERAMDLPEETSIIGTIKEPNIEAIIALSPDLVLLSPDVENHVKIAETFEQSRISYAFFKVEHFEDYLDMLKTCTDITGHDELYEKNGLAIKNQIETVLAKIDGKDGPDILFVRAFSSGAKAKSDDNMTCRILNDLSTVNIAAKHASLLEDLSIEEIIEEDPDYIFVVTMGDSEKALQALKDGIEKNPAWSGLSAVKNDRYIVLPKELFHYKPNAKWGESYEYMAKILYPDAFK